MSNEVMTRNSESDIQKILMANYRDAYRMKGL